MLLSEICKILTLDFKGEDKEIISLNTLDDAKNNEMSFIDNPKYLSSLKTTKAYAVLVDKKYQDNIPSSTIALFTDEPYLKLAYASKIFASKVLEDSGVYPEVDKSAKISPTAYVGEGAKIGANVQLLPNAFIGDYVEIKENTIVYPSVSIYRNTKIGKNCIIHAGSVIGSDGFGFAHTKTGEHIKIYQNGNVEIGDNVEIGGNCTIDRAVFGSTIIKNGCKIDNLVHIGHNCTIGEHSILVGQSGLAGSSTFGRNFVLGAQSGVSGHLNIAPFTTVAAKSALTKSIKESGKTFAGFPSFEHRKWLRLQAKIAKLLK